MRGKSWVLFDFDGTIADSSIALLSAFNYLSREFKYKQISIDELGELRNQEGLKLLVGKLGWKFWNIPTFTRRMREEIAIRQSDIGLFSDIDSVIKELHKTSRLGIISSNSPATITAFLQHFKLENYFECVIGDAGYFSKKHSFLNFMDNYRVTADDILYVADEGRDISFCNRLNIPIISVTWGYDDIKILKKKKPTYIAQNPYDILTIYGNHFHS